MSLNLRDTEVENRVDFRVRELRLEGFRNYDTARVDLGEGFNVLSGPNAQGKTNFLEAIYLMATTRLLRGQKDAEAIQQGREKADVRITLSGTETLLGMALERGVRKRASINGLGLPRASDLIGRLPAVCISSVDMAIIRGEPADRRMFLDLELSALYPRYLNDLAMYKRALEQRNALLRASKEWMQPAEVFEPWEAQMAQHGAALREARVAFIRRLRPLAQGVHAEMGSGELIDFRYELRDESDLYGSLLEAYARTRMSDVGRGSTTVGPHRDEVRIDVQEREGRLYGSQGQQRTAVIAIKVACLQLATEEQGAPPILLLDDILSDLDESRRALLVEVVLSRAGQAVLTCTESSAAGQRILERAQLFEVSAGVVRRA